MPFSSRLRLPLLLTIALTLSALLTPLPLWAQHREGGTARSKAPLAEVVLAAGRVGWLASPETSAVAGLTLSVADPAGVVHSAVFAPGEAVSFPPADPQGAALPDGLYTYELRTIERVPESIRVRLEKARQVGNEALVRRLQAALPRPLVQSGTFRVSTGALVAEGGSEPNEGAPTKDQTVPDDLIVDGKGCVGLGCAANETFGQEALRLKQSVVRLRFEDTSAQPGFPAGDWQLTANDAASGGANRFSLEDLAAGTTPVTVRGGAPNNSLVVDSQGRLGLGTAVPARSFHLTSPTLPALRLEQTGGTPRTWDLLADSASFRVVDQSNSGAVPVQFAAGAPTNSLVVNSSGYLGLGVNPPTAPFHLRASVPGNVTGRVQNTSPTGYPGIEFLRHTGEAVFFFGVDNAGTFTRLNSIQFFPLVLMTESQPRLKIQFDGMIALGGLGTATHPLHHANGAHLTAGGVWTNASSRRFKQDIHDLDSMAAITALEGLKPVEFAYKADPAEQHVGFIAEDVPALVAENGREGLSPMDVVAVLTKVVQDQQKEIEAQRELVRQLAERLAALDGKR